MKWQILAAAALASAAVASTARAEFGPDDKLSLNLSNDIVTTYYFRGYQREDSGFIDQPSATLYYNMAKSENARADVFIGNWNSLHSEARGQDTDDDGIWYESDIYAGFDFGFGHTILTPMYTFYTYPQSGYEKVHEFGLRMKYDDRYLTERYDWYVIALQPSIAYFSEFNGTNTRFDDEATYVEVGIAPVIPTGKRCPATLSLPMALGMSLDNYYREADGQNSTFGYASFGILVNYRLPIDTKYGQWSLNTGLTYVQLLANSTRASDGGDSDDWIGRLGLSVLF